VGEINLTPFEEEEAFTQTGLSGRFFEVGQGGIDDLTKVAFQDGCLNENHSPSFLSFSQTVEFPSDALVATQDAVLGVSYHSSYLVAIQTGLSYWNKMTSSTTRIMNYPPLDGVWGPIQDGAGNDLKCTLPASIDLSGQFNSRFGVSALLVMMNVQLERFEFYEIDGTTPVVPSPSESDQQGAAFAIQVSDDNVNWYHLYLGDSTHTDSTGTATGNPPYRYRVTERRIEGWDREVTLTSRVASSTNLPSRRDVAIRTIINASSIANTTDASNAKGAISSFRYIRGVVSLIKGGNIFDKFMRVRIRKANLTVLALRANEVDPNA